MQVFGLPRQLIRAGAVASRIAAQPSGSEAAIRRDAVARWLELRRHGLTAEQAARGVGHGRSKLYRWQEEAEPKSRRPHRVRPRTWTPELLETIERLRDDNPMWGKEKIVVLLAREGIRTSASTVGRILKSLVERGVVIPVPTLRRRPGPRRLRLTTKERHARRLPKGLKPTRPGEIVQIDTLFVNVRPDKPIKQITAYDPVAKWTLGRVATSASARSATALLDKLLLEAPFAVTGIQVDGGSEFRAEFEEACRDRGLALFVLPPRRPQLNGAVERAQGSWRYEFYACFDLPHRIDKLQEHVDAFAHRFNHHRPHQALGGQTPAEYLKAISRRDPGASHMC
jgi:transposase InsO family protein